MLTPTAAATRRTIRSISKELRNNSNYETTFVLNEGSRFEGYIRAPSSSGVSFQINDGNFVNLRQSEGWQPITIYGPATLVNIDSSDSLEIYGNIFE